MNSSGEGSSGQDLKGRTYKYISRLLRSTLAVFAAEHLALTGFD